MGCCVLCIRRSQPRRRCMWGRRRTREGEKTGKTNMMWFARTFFVNHEHIAGPIVLRSIIDVAESQRTQGSSCGVQSWWRGIGKPCYHFLQTQLFFANLKTGCMNRSNHSSLLFFFAFAPYLDTDSWSVVLGRNCLSFFSLSLFRMSPRERKGKREGRSNITHRRVHASFDEKHVCVYCDMYLDKNKEREETEKAIDLTAQCLIFMVWGFVQVGCGLSREGQGCQWRCGIVKPLCCCFRCCCCCWTEWLWELGGGGGWFWMGMRVWMWMEFHSKCFSCCGYNFWTTNEDKKKGAEVKDWLE